MPQKEYDIDARVVEMINSLPNDSKSRVFEELSENTRAVFILKKIGHISVVDVVAHLIEQLGIGSGAINNTVPYVYLENEKNRCSVFGIRNFKKSNAKLYEALKGAGISDSNLEDNLRSKSDDYVIVEEHNGLIILKTDSIRLNQILKSLPEDKLQLAKASTFLLKTYVYFFKRREEDIRLGREKTVDFKGLEVELPFSFNGKIFHLKGSMRDVEESLSKELGTFSRIIQNGFVSGVTIGGKKFNFNANNNEIAVTSISKHAPGTPINSFIEEIERNEEDLSRLIDRVFFPIEEGEMKSSNISVQLIGTEKLHLCFGEDEGSKRNIIDIHVGYVRIDGNEGAFLLEGRSFDIDLKVQCIAKMASGNKNKGLKEFLKDVTDECKDLLYCKYLTDSESGGGEEITSEKLTVSSGDVYIMYQENLSTIRCLRVKNGKTYQIYQYNISYAINEIVTKTKLSRLNVNTEDRNELIECFETFIEDFGSGEFEDLQRHDEDEITKRIVKFKNESEGGEYYSFGGKEGDDSEIADMIRTNKDASDLRLYHFKRPPFVTYPDKAGYTNVNMVIGQVLQKAYFANRSIEGNIELNFKGKDHIRKFKELPTNKKITIYINESLSRFFNLDKANFMSPSEDEKRKIAWMQLIFIRNILESDISNFAFGKGKTETGFRIIFKAKRSDWKKIQGLPEESGDHEKFMLLDFDAGRFIDKKEA